MAPSRVVAVGLSGLFAAPTPYLAPATMKPLSPASLPSALPAPLPAPALGAVPAASLPAAPAAALPARPALEALSARVSAAPAQAAPALDARFDGVSAPPCAACAGDAVPASDSGRAAAPGVPALPPSGRLPKGVAPRRYDLTLTLEPEAGTFRGRVAMTVSVAAPADRIVLNALDLAIGEVRVAGRRLDPSRVVVDAKAETVTLLLDAPLKKGAAAVEIAYEGRMNELMRGLFKARGRADGREEAWAFTHLEPTHARRVLPCFDEPEAKAEFRLTLDVPAALTPLSNMPVVSETVADGRKTTTFAPTPRMSSYLLAVFAARLSPKSVKVGRTLVTVWAPADQLGQADFALDAAARALKSLNAYFALPYSLPKLDLVVSPDFASGAMENWGAILFRDASLLIDPKLSSDAAKRRVAEVVTHEIVHQWFGNLVTMRWWNDLWLNEAFATWLAAKIVDRRVPEWKVWDDFDQGKRFPLSIDALPGARPVRSDAATPAEIQAMFDPMSYQKGGALLRMLELHLGEEDFRAGVRAYIRRFARGNAEAGDLARELEKASGQPVRRMLDGWLTRAGVPVVTATAAGRTLTLTQERFSAAGPADGTLWTVPVAVRYRLKGETRARELRVLLDGASKTVTLPGRGEPSWVYPNAGETGYYRVALSPELLAAALARRGELSPAERAGLLNHLWAAARAGRLPVSRFLDALAAFRGDPSRMILEDAAAYLKTLRQDLAADDETRAALGAFAADFFAPARARLGWEKKKGESADDALARPAVLGALALHAAGTGFADEAAPRLAAYLDDPASLDAAVAPVVVAAAARRNDPALFEAFRARLAAPKTPEQKDLMLRALSEFSAPELLDRALALTLTDEVRAQDAWKPFVWILSAPATRERGWEFVKARWPALVAKVGPRGATRIVGAAAGLATPELRAEVESFFRDPKNEVEMARRTLAQTLAAIDLSLRFRAGQQESFRQWSGLSANAGRFSPAAFKAFERIAALWGLTGAQRRALLGVDARAYAAWRKDPSRLSVAALERVSLTLGVYRRLHELLGGAAADGWVKRGNKAFGGRPALELMLSPDPAGLRGVRDHLLGAGGGWF
ncbi:MAG: ERAP1-like C-terminal domain-containing protein [Elusimicrobia bacterium]|nr:ERAP1-like C-terminal domain-containing protein [Elusimicrobiota bacterium]